MLQRHCQEGENNRYLLSDKELIFRIDKELITQ